MLVLEALRCSSAAQQFFQVLDVPPFHAALGPAQLLLLDLKINLRIPLIAGNGVVIVVGSSVDQVSPPYARDILQMHSRIRPQLFKASPVQLGHLL